MFDIKKLKYLIIFVIIFLTAGTNFAKAETVKFDDIMSKAIDNSYDLKLSAVDIDISKATVKETKSLYWPTLKTDFYSEYARDLTNGYPTFSSVGSTVLTTSTKYQDLLSIGVSYDLFDFGVRGKKLFIAKKDVLSKKFTYNQAKRELKLNIVDLYTNALLAYKDLKTKQEEYPIYKELLEIKENLYKAGTASKVEVSDSAIKVAKTFDDIDTLKTKLKIALNDISLYTRENYDSEKTVISDFPEQLESYINNVNFEKKSGQTYQLGIEKKEAALNINTIDYEKTPDYKIYQLEIEKKQAELSVQKRERLPSVGLYSNYNLYGTDQTSPFSSLSDFKQRGLTVGVSATMTPFDGFKTSADIKKLELEVERLKLERDQKIAELKNKYEKLNDIAIYYDGQLETQQQLLLKIQDKIAMLEKLAQQQLISRDDLLSQKSDLIDQKTEVEKSIINKISSIKKLNVYSEELGLVK